MRTGKRTQAERDGEQVAEKRQGGEGCIERRTPVANELLAECGMISGVGFLDSAGVGPGYGPRSAEHRISGFSQTLMSGRGMTVYTAGLRSRSGTNRKPFFPTSKFATCEASDASIHVFPDVAMRVQEERSRRA
jgi:hypothetical protein